MKTAKEWAIEYGVALGALDKANHDSILETEWFARLEKTIREIQIDALVGIKSENSESKDAERFRWLIEQGLAWRDCYDHYWLPGEWLYDRQEARSFVDKAMSNDSR